MSRAWTPELRAKVLESGRVRHLTEISDPVRVLFQTAHEIPADRITLEPWCVRCDWSLT